MTDWESLMSIIQSAKQEFEELPEYQRIALTAAFDKAEEEGRWIAAGGPDQ